MSRIARKPLIIPKSVTVDQVDSHNFNIKGPKGEFNHSVHFAVDVAVNGSEITLSLAEGKHEHKAQLGTACVLFANCIKGVSEGFEKKLTLVGVGYRAKVQGSALELNLGYSHPVVYPIPAGISIETPSATEIIVRGFDKQKVGQVSAEIREKRPPESYKGKGVRYADERIVLKETKKK